jgi:Mlc titration factor MtfA (ptsG expression regulator)
MDTHLPLAFLLAALGALAWFASQPWRQSRHRQRIRRQPFPAAWRRILRRRVPLAARLPADLLIRLKQEIQVFLAEIPIIGCDGLVVNDEMRVTIAAQACLPLLGGRQGDYPKLRQILLYPAPFLVDRPEFDSDTPQLERTSRQALAGESWEQGQVLLSWRDVLAGANQPKEGYNVVIHECAHQLDQVKGFANGAPLLPNRRAYQAWARTMRLEYEALRERLARGDTGLIDPYAGSDPAEFFAVCSEVFFHRPRELASAHPALYEQLRWYYKLDPASWA